MLELPASVLDYIHTLTVANRFPAYLLVEKDGRLSDWGGKLAAYGITNLQKGEYVGKQVFFLEGLLPLDGSPMFLPCIKTEYGLSVDVHIFSKEEQDWVLLLDATLDESQLSLIQQKQNDLSLLLEKQFRILNQKSRRLDRYLGADTNQFLPVKTINPSITDELFAVLDIVVLEQLNDGFFGILGVVPDWFMHFYPDAALERERLKIGEKFPFLDNFLIDAEYFWMGNSAEPLKSGLWSEIDELGEECHFEALAVRLEKKKILLISLVEFAYKEKQSLIQKGRENSLSYYRLFQEIQKKEILINCIVHDLAGQIMGISYCLELLALQNLTAKAREYVESGRKQSSKQGMLIREIMDAFSAEVESLDAFTLDPTQAPDALVCAREVVEALLPSFLLSKRNLQLNPDIDISQDWKVAGEKSRFDRVLSNLLENALRHSPADSTVIVDVKDDGEFIIVTVDDEGPGVPQDISKTLFQKFCQGKEKSGKAGLGLYFCRITVERWGGTIGYFPRTTGGSRFWFRLPRLTLR